MNDSLSQDQIDLLLNQGVSEGGVDPILRTNRIRKIKSYDFRRPDKFSKDQIRTLQMIHDTFARLMTTSLSTQLRLMVSIHMVSIDQVTYEEFLRSTSNPSTLAIVNMDPLKGSVIFEIDPVVTFIMIDRLFGGKGSMMRLYRDLTEIEIAAVETVVMRILNNLRESWASVLDLRPRLTNIETNPQFAQIVPPNDMVVLITFSIKIGDTEGLLNLCIPYLTIESIVNNLSAQFWYSSAGKKLSPENLQLLEKTVSNSLHKLQVEVGSISVLFQEVLDLEIGDILCLKGSKLNDGVDLKIGNSSKFKVKPGRVKDKLAVQIVDIIK